uniref:K Homology domain-containing protein n=1 Tax=Ditylenchus dipsaci TaxID=166011 RepID=A0A915EJ52_9BILA
MSENYSNLAQSMRRAELEAAAEMFSRDGRRAAYPDNRGTTSHRSMEMLDNDIRISQRTPEDSWIRSSNYLADQMAEAKYAALVDRNQFGTGEGSYSRVAGGSSYLPSSVRDYPTPSSSVFGNHVRSSMYDDFGSSNMKRESRSPTLVYERNEPVFSSNSMVTKPKRPALVGSPPPGAATFAPAPSANSKYVGKNGNSSSVGGGPASSFGLGVGKYGNEIPSPLDAEIQHTILEMQQELAYIDTLPQTNNLRHSKRLLKERCAKLESTVDPDWVEVDISKPIKVTKRVLIPIFRHSTFNYVGRILGPKGVTLKNICKKFKCFISVMGAGSTKDRTKELELLNSNDPRFAHYASPLHIRIDTVAPAHVAHMRMAACLNVFHKLLIPGKDVYIEGICEPVHPIQNSTDVSTNNKAEDAVDKEVDEFEEEFTFGADKPDEDYGGEKTKRHDNNPSASSSNEADLLHLEVVEVEGLCPEDVKTTIEASPTSPKKHRNQQQCVIEESLKKYD